MDIMQDNLIFGFTIVERKSKEELENLYNVYNYQIRECSGYYEIFCNEEKVCTIFTEKGLKDFKRGYDIYLKQNRDVALLRTSQANL